MDNNYPEIGDWINVNDPIRGKAFRCQVSTVHSENCVDAIAPDIPTANPDPDHPFFEYREIFRTQRDPQRCTWSFA